MQVFAEVVDSEGVVVARSESDVTQDGDIAGVVAAVIDRFRSGHPDKSLLSALPGGHTIRLGKG
jgi:hypothetical protein